MGFADQQISVADNPGPWAILIFGPPKAGKTIFALDGSPRPLLLDVEKGRRSLLNHKHLVHTPILVTPSYKDVEKVAFGIIDKDPYFDDKDTIVIDTISELQQRDLRQQVKEAHQQNSNRHPYLPSQAEYNINNLKLRNLVLAFREQTDKNLILLCHVKEEKDDEGSTVLIRPNTSPTLSGGLMGLMDGIFYFTASNRSGTVTRKMVNLGNNRTMAGSRFNLPSEMENPHFSIILQAEAKQKETAAAIIKEREATQVQTETDLSAKTETSVLNL